MSKIEQFEEEVKVLLSGYFGTDPDTADYLALKVRKLHEKYSEKENTSNGCQWK